jgi:hypothetical protein
MPSFARALSAVALGLVLMPHAAARGRFDLSLYARPDAQSGLALFVHADNLANRHLWLPDWGGGTGDTIAVHRRRTIYFGLEVTMRRE